MSCLEFEQIASYLLRELDDIAAAAVEAHYFACAACTRAVEDVQALIATLAATIPPVVSRARVERLRGAGVRLRETEVDAGGDADVHFTRDVDLLVHILHADLAGAERVDVEVLGGDRLLFRVDAAPFDEGAVLIACQRHYADLGPADITFRVIAVRAGASAVAGEYLVRHHWL